MTSFEERPALISEPSDERIREWIAELMDITPEDLPSPAEDLVDHGLHSVAVMQFADRCRRFGVTIDVRHLSENPTIAYWSALVAEGRGRQET
ncbi:phosphopantetheine-binding protein [Streptomyces fungicidicus]|uniref:phosphopantetheine-binding protein n=1 Tax=Streptomyces fungicidicus TaxID=68203 RepID=UPI00369D6942